MQRTNQDSKQFEAEVAAGKRFTFGKNWRSFLRTLNEKRIEAAEVAFKKLIKLDNLEEKSFIDVGSGSGLSSLVARRMGATVHSFDYDPDSVACTTIVRDRYYPDDDDWTVEQGSALDRDYIDSLGTFDVVYSWGVLHHSGDMWRAIENVTRLVNEDGLIFLALYNDQGKRSILWRKVKQITLSGTAGRLLMMSIFIPYWTFRVALRSVINRRNEFVAYRNNRGMSIVHDWLDWLGGYPFEVARIDAVVNYYLDRGFRLVGIRSNCGLGCNEFVFRAEREQEAAK